MVIARRIGEDGNIVIFGSFFTLEQLPLFLSCCMLIRV